LHVSGFYNFHWKSESRPAKPGKQPKGADAMKYRVHVMKSFVASCIVLCGILGSACGQANKAAQKPLANGKEPAAGPTKITVDLGGSVKLEMTLIPAGEFMMGSGESAKATAEFFNKIDGDDFYTAEWFDDEHPQHHVRITRPFYLGTYHVTRGQFRQFVADTHYATDVEKSVKPGTRGWNPKTKEYEFNEKFCWRDTGFAQSDDHPVVNVSWKDAEAFCAWLGKKEGKTYRLPTEAEWEYACRAGMKTRYSSGDDPETLAKVGNITDAAYKATFPGDKSAIKASDGYVFTSPVGSYQPNAFGLFDMHGNAWQWCSDWYDKKSYAKSTTDDPTGPASGFDHVLRGGSWRDWPLTTRSASRAWLGSVLVCGSIGFRVARTQ
jgi:formylglycine-generating enzyme required for sulfatase activity